MWHRDFGWLFIVLFFGVIFLFRGCGWGWGSGGGWGGCCGAPRWPRRFHNHDSGNENSEALEILNQRYAKGEIDEEEYKRKKTDIMG